jgi:UDP-glucose:(heptosyl)LPS alpha-1,3-glucosyltransferase
MRFGWRKIRPVANVWVSPKHQSYLKGMMFQDFMQLNGLVVRQAANRKTMRLIISGQSYFIKQHLGIGWGEIFKNLLTGKKPIIGALTEANAIQAMMKLGIKTTPLAAYGATNSLPSSQQSFLLTEDLGDILSVEDVCKSWALSPPSDELRQNILVAIAKLASKFHGAGFCHRDFYICHLAFPREQELNSNTDFYLLDLHRVVRLKDAKDKAIAKDIAALIFSCMDFGFTSRDWEVFKNNYLPQNQEFWEFVKARAEQLHRKFHQKIAI